MTTTLFRYGHLHGNGACSHRRSKGETRMKASTTLAVMEALMATNLQDLVKMQTPLKSTIGLTGDLIVAQESYGNTEIRRAKTREFLENSFELVLDPFPSRVTLDDEPATSTDTKNILADPERVAQLMGLMEAEDALYRNLELKKERMEMRRRMGLDEDIYLPDPAETNLWGNSPPAPGCGYNNKKKVRKEHKRTVRKIAKRSRQINRSKK